MEAAGVETAHPATSDIATATSGVAASGTTTTPPGQRPESGGILASLRQLGPYLRGKRWRFVCGALAALGASLIALSIPQLLRELVNGPLSGGGDLAGLLWASAAVLGLGVLEAALIVSRRQLVMYPGTQVEAEMRTSLFRHLTDLPIAYHSGVGSGQLLSRSMTDLGIVRRWLGFGLVMLVVNSLTIVAGILLMFRSSWLLGLIYLVAAVPVVVVSYRFRRSYRAASRLSQDQTGDLATTVEESVLGIRVLKAFGRGRHALERFAGQADTLRGTELRKARALSTISLVLSLVPEIALGLALFAGLWLISADRLSPGALVAFFATAAVVAGPLDRVGNLFAVTLDARTAIDRFSDVMDTENDIVDPVASEQPGVARGEVVLDGVSFRYPVAGRDDPVLHDISLRIAPGETVAVVGMTGSGKSTLAQLVPRLLDTTEGSIRVDGVDVRDYTRRELRRIVSIAFEDPVLFSDTVRENVLLGAPVRDDAALAEALRIAQAGFVRGLPLGVETLVGEEGLSLSGGQRQRLALARAVAARPLVMVLDDPLSALDVHTEAAVQRELRTALRGTTTIIVAHRPSTVALADRVVLLRDGAVEAVGSHSELLATSEHYRHVISNADPAVVA